MQRIILLFTFVFTTTILIAQTQNEHSGCGTIDQDLTWLRKFQQNPELFPMPEEDLIIASLQVHNVGNDDENGFFHMRSMLDALCTLQNDFAEVDIQFYMENDFNYISNTGWNNHEEFSEGYQLMSQNKVSGALNAFIATEAAGNCGYYAPGQDCCVVAKSCASPSDHTWSHEMGHYLSLPHPFVGWEGIDYDPAVPTSNYENQVWGPIEKLDGSNCHFAADGFCDTAPDYLSNRWSCNSDDESNMTLTDPNGEEFHVDGTIIMSYSDDLCANRFSEEQQAAMRANLIFQRQNVILDNVEIEEIDITSFTTVNPQPDDVVPHNFLEVEWEEMPGATHYYVQVARHPWDVVIHDEVTSGTSLTVTDLLPNKSYYYKVRPYNMGYFCAGFSEKVIFETSDVTAVNELETVSDVSIYPTILQKGSRLNIDFQSETTIENATLTVTSSTGVRQSLNAVQILAGKNRFKVQPQNLSSGIYFVSIETAEGSFYEKFIVQ